MSSLALASPDGSLTMLEPVAKPIRNRVKQARDYRAKQFESSWQLNLAFASGKHWVGWHEKTRSLRSIQELDPRYRGRELISEDVLNEYRTTALGELGSDNDRPELLLRRDDIASEDFQETLNKAVGYGWDHEWHGDDVLAQIDRYMIDLGTAAVRCRYDNTQGPVVADNIPHFNGKPVLDVAQATAMLGDGPNPAVTMRPLKEGRICWEPLSAFNILMPAGATHEDTTPWEAVIRPAYLPDVQERYGAAATDLHEDSDIATALGVSTTGASLAPATYAVTDAATSRLRDHVWLIDYYERPSVRFASGRQFTFAGNDMRLVDYVERLPYQAPDGTFRSGIAYFHWWRVTGRFFSRSLVDVLRQGQFGINKRRTQINEIIDKNMPYVIVQKDSLAKRRAGQVNEIVEIEASERDPKPVAGIGPGAWMQADVESLREGLVHASGINGPRRGENPQNVTTYSQLALINELDTAKREPIYLERKRSIGRLLEDTVYDIRTYWGPSKQLALAGEDDQLEASVFDATRIPTFFIVQVGKGQAKPRSAAAELQKINDIWAAALNAQAVVSNPSGWVAWFKESIQAGEPLDLPSEGMEDPAEKAEYENHYMRDGVPMPIAYYDVHAAHLPRHRYAQDQAMFAQDVALWQLIENHCQLHIAAAQAQAQAQLEQMQAAQPGRPTPPPSPGPPPVQQ